MEDKQDQNLEELLAPAAFNISSNYIQIGDKYARTIFLSTYPRYLNTNWFSPVINLDRILDISIFILPKNTVVVMKQLRDQLARLESQTMEEASKGKVRDPMLETAIQDIENLRDQLQQGTDKFFELGVYITIYEDSVKKLDETESKIKGFLEYQLVFSKSAIFRMNEGFISTLPINQDKLNIHTSLNTEPLSSIFPFISFDLTSNSGILYGINTHNNSLVLFDRFNLENANAVVFGKSGGGKSLIFSESVLIKQREEIKMVEIGSLIDKLIKKHGATQIDAELEGVILPDIKVWAFDKNLKGSWSKVTVAARKKATEHFYRFTTKSGRQITTTGDHNMVIMREGRIVDTKSSKIKKGAYVPLSRRIESAAQPTRSLNLLEILKDSKGIYVSGAKTIITENYQALKKAGIDRLEAYLYKYRSDRVIPVDYFLKIIKFLNIDISDPRITSLKITSKLGKNYLPVLWPINKSFAKILGYIVSEGTITEDIIIISNLDQEVIKDAQSALKSMSVRYYLTNMGIVIAERVFVEIVKALGGKKKSAQKNVLPFLFNTDKKVIATYLRTYFEGDGGVEHASVSAVSKSKGLMSGICYLFYLFGIIGRIKQTNKKAPSWKYKKTYWKLVISGQDNLKKFADNIGFISKRKNKLLSTLILKPANTNVDIIPGLAPVFERIYQLISPRFFNIQDVNAIKRGIYNPSPEKLKRVITEIHGKIGDLREYGINNKLFDLPDIENLIEKGRATKKLNRKLRGELGASWQLMKRGVVAPKTENVLRALRTIQPSFLTSLQDIKRDIYNGFQIMSLPVNHYTRTLQSALVDRPDSNTSYGLVSDTRRYLLENYRKKLKDLLELEQLLSRLETIAEADLFWDPIEKIEKIKNRREKYVYDLTVDNEVFLAGTGGLFVHNSYTVKLEILRSLIFGTQVLVVDPEDEYKYLSDTVGGSSVKISINSDHHINPFDLPIPKENESPADVFKSHILDLTGLLKLMLGDLTPEEGAVLDEALIQTYAIKDITPESDFTKMPPPLLSDLQSILEGLTGAESIAIRLKKYTQGTFAGFLNNPTNVPLDNSLVVFSIKDMEEELRPVAMYLILNFIWVFVRRRLIKRIIVVDEAWWLMKYELGANFLSGLAKRARKYYVGLTTISQDIPDFLASPQGKTILTNSSIQMLMKQSSAAIDIVQQTFNLTDSEKFYLLEARIGFGLFFLGQSHVGIRVVASYAEDQIITSDPRQILEIEKAKEEWANTNK